MAMIYLNTAGFGQLYPTAVELTRRLTQEQVDLGIIEVNKSRANRIPAIRSQIASYFGVADPSRVCFIPNTSVGINFLAASLDKDKTVALFQSDYPSITYPWQLQGFPTVTIDTDTGKDLTAEMIIQALKEKKPGIMVVSHVHWQTGTLLEWDEIRSYCKENGIVTIVDATQSLGVIPIQMDDFGADVVISSGYKWLNAGFGIGLMLLGEGFCERYPPKTAGYASFSFHLDPPEYVSGPSGFEPGSSNILGIEVLSDAIRTKQEIGADKIYEHCLSLTRTAEAHLSRAGLQPLARTKGSSIIGVNANQTVSDRLSAEEINHTFRDGVIRLSFHHTNTEEEIAVLKDALSD